ncbi:MAG: hypothetical protein OXF79_20390 [Chloroflexi bacterium]|nr:hypothetical protein [Chloroflexota bacterium]
MPVNLADVAVPPRCEQMIRAGALVVVNWSGGKDSQTMTILLSRIVAREQLLVVHAPLGEMEWPGTVELIEATLPEAKRRHAPFVHHGRTMQLLEEGLHPERAVVAEPRRLRPRQTATLSTPASRATRMR